MRVTGPLITPPLVPYLSRRLETFNRCCCWREMLRFWTRGGVRVDAFPELLTSKRRLSLRVTAKSLPNGGQRLRAGTRKGATRGTNSELGVMVRPEFRASKHGRKRGRRKERNEGIGGDGVTTPTVDKVRVLWNTNKTFTRWDHTMPCVSIDL